MKHRPAERSTVLIERSNRLGRCGEEVASIEPLVLKVVEHGAVERIGARAADHVDLAAGDAAIFGRQHAFDDLYLSDRVDAHDRNLVLTAVLIHRPLFGTRIRFSPIDGDARASSSDTTHLHVTLVHVHAGCKTQQIRNVAAIDWQLANLLRSQRRGLTGRCGLDERRLCGHRDTFLHGAELECEGLPHRLTRTELYAFVGVGLETGQRDPD